jgi:hypothetical protein
LQNPILRRIEPIEDGLRERDAPADTPRAPHLAKRIDRAIIVPRI